MRQKQSLLEGAHPVTSEVLLLHHALLWYRFVTIANAFEMKDNEIMAGGVKCHFCNNIKCQRYKTGGGGWVGIEKLKKQWAYHLLAHMPMSSLIPVPYVMVSTMRSKPVMREARAVLITCSGSEDLCQSLRAHFKQLENVLQCPLVFDFLFLFLAYVTWVFSRFSLLLCFFFLPLLLLSPLFLPLQCISLLIYVNPLAVRMKLV